MLQQMRQMKMFVFWFVAVVFIVGFVFFGGLDVPKLGRGGKNAVASINGENVSPEVYSRTITQMAESQRQRFSRDELSSADYERIESEAWDTIISEMLVRQEAERLGIQAADQEIVDVLTSSPPQWVQQRFVDEAGRFDAQRFHAAINDPNYNWGPDEQYLRLALPSAKLQTMVRAQATVSEAEVREEFARRNLRTTVRYAGIPSTSIDLGAWEPGDAALHAYYDKHPEQFARGETVTLEVIRVDKKPSATDDADALSSAREVLDEEKKGETFAALAEGYSDDATSTRGGDLGWVTPGNLQPALRETAAALAAGQTSAAVRGDRGFFILHADSVRTTANGKEVRLRQILLIPKLSPDTLDSLRTQVVEAAKTATKDFPGAAAALGATVQKLDPVENLGYLPGIGYSKRLVDWAFGAPVGDVSPPMGTDNLMLIGRLVAKNPKSTRSFDEAAPQVRALVLDAERKQRARERLQRVLDHVRAGTMLDNAAKAEGLTVEQPAPFNFYENVAGVGGANEFTAVAGALPPGQTSGIVETANGAYILQVVSRDPFDAQAYEKERSSVYQSLLAQREAQVFTAWLKELRERAKIEDRRGPRV
jgi:peptidyl-prolyl cis-trans isomerase D